MMKIYLSNLVPSPTSGSYCIKGSKLYVAQYKTGTSWGHYEWVEVGNTSSSTPQPPVLIVKNV